MEPSVSFPFTVDFSYTVKDDISSGDHVYTTLALLYKDDSYRLWVIDGEDSIDIKLNADQVRDLSNLLLALRRATETIS